MSFSVVFCAIFLNKFEFSTEFSPVEISHGMTIRREDLCNAHEEADVIVIHQMLSVVKSSTNDMYLKGHCIEFGVV